MVTSRGLGRLGVGTCMLLLCAAATAQVRPVNSGNALDANPMVGSGGTNAARPAQTGVNGNLIITGNVTGGRAFQGYSPIANPSALQTAVGSASLSNFVRDSVGLPGVQSGLSNYAPRPYFDPSQTAVTAGAIESQAILPRDVSGIYRVGQYAYQMPVTPLTSTQRIGQARPTDLPYAAGGWTPAGLGMFNPELLATTPGQAGRDPLSAYSFRAPLEVSEVARAPWQTGQQERAGADDRPGARFGEPGQPDDTGRADAQGQTNETPGLPSDVQVTRSIRPSIGREGSPGVRGEVGQRGGSGDQANSSLLTEMQQYTAGIQTIAPPGQQPLGQPQGRQQQQQPLDLSVATAAQRPADELRMLQPAATPLQRERLRGDIGRQQAAQLVEERLRVPIRSLAGARHTQVDQMLARAEELMGKGEYYRAAEIYNGVIRTAPDNALAWLGRANAMLAAGEYLGAYVALERGVSRFPRMLEFDYDLPALVGNKDILDMRRAELEKMLAGRPDYRTRFLLGYLEYFSGVRGEGLKTIGEAAKAAPEGSAVPQAYEVLQGRGGPTTQPAR